ncbi:MAG TPA: hypothetical protein VN690_00070 [Terriglobales bacterium]|nr:hypothetical protein [Terriglobales bacterium]
MRCVQTAVAVALAAGMASGQRIFQATTKLVNVGLDLIGRGGERVVVRVRAHDVLQGAVGRVVALHVARGDVGGEEHRSHAALSQPPGVGHGAVIRN